VYGYLQDFLFTPERARTPVKALSGGERARLLLAKLFLNPGNLLVMDEPTNDLDIETLELLEEQLLDYPGTLVMVSHDREFLDHVVTSSFVLEGDGTVNFCVGGYADWLRQRANAATPAASAVAEASPVARPARQRDDRLGYAEKRELAALPGKIEVLEQEVAAIHALLADPTAYVRDASGAAAAAERLPAAQAELESVLERWMALEARNG
jgi:ATP-binding cassette subfamily F protein uup